MYADMQMQGHGLMQATARVKRVFRDKPGGLVVDYQGLAEQFKRAHAVYAESGGQGDSTFDTALSIAVLLEKHGVACDMMHGFNRDRWITGTTTERLQVRENVGAQLRVIRETHSAQMGLPAGPCR